MVVCDWMDRNRPCFLLGVLLHPFLFRVIAVEESNRAMQPPTEKSDCIQLSAVIVTYNNIDMIADCLASLSQALHSLLSASEVLLIDNASSDQTGRWLQAHRRDLRKQFAQHQVILNDNNLGYTAGVNQGLKHATGRYILLLNPDIILQRDTIHTLLQCLESNPAIGVVAPQLRFLNDRIQPSCRNFPRKRDVIYDSTGLSFFFSKSAEFNRWRMGDYSHRESREVDQPQGAFLLARKTALDAVGLLDERFPMFFSDVDWCRRVKQQDWRILYCADTYAYHKRGASVFQKRPEMIVSSHRSFIQYFRKLDSTLWQKTGTALLHLLLLVITLPRVVFSFLERRN